MGDLIVMTRPTRPSPAIMGGNADILFFTGVRYYRMPEDIAAPVAAKTSPRRRTQKAKQAALARRLERNG